MNIFHNCFIIGWSRQENHFYPSKSAWILHGLHDNEKIIIIQFGASSPEIDEPRKQKHLSDFLSCGWQLLPKRLSPLV